MNSLDHALAILISEKSFTLEIALAPFTLARFGPTLGICESMTDFSLNFKGLAVLMVKFGEVIEFHLGNNTVDGLDQYARLLGEEEVLLVPSVWGEVVSRLATDPPYGRLR